MKFLKTLLVVGLFALAHSAPTILKPDAHQKRDGSIVDLIPETKKVTDDGLEFNGQIMKEYVSGSIKIKGEVIFSGDIHKSGLVSGSYKDKNDPMPVMRQFKKMIFSKKSLDYVGFCFENSELCFNIKNIREAINFQLIVEHPPFAGSPADTVSTILVDGLYDQTRQYTIPVTGPGNENPLNLNIMANVVSNFEERNIIMSYLVLYQVVGVEIQILIVKRNMHPTSADSFNIDSPPRGRICLPFTSENSLEVAKLGAREEIGFKDNIDYTYIDEHIQYGSAGKYIKSSFYHLAKCCPLKMKELRQTNTKKFEFMTFDKAKNTWNNLNPKTYIADELVDMLNDFEITIKNSHLYYSTVGIQPYPNYEIEEVAVIKLRVFEYEFEKQIKTTMTESAWMIYCCGKEAADEPNKSLMVVLKDKLSFLKMWHNWVFGIDDDTTQPQTAINALKKEVDNYNEAINGDKEKAKLLDLEKSETVFFDAGSICFGHVNQHLFGEDGKETKEGKEIQNAVCRFCRVIFYNIVIAECYHARPQDKQKPTPK